MSYSFTAPRKDPQAVLDYGMDWSAWLADGETIADISIACNVDEATISDEAEADGVVRWRMGGGVAGTSILVTVEITTSAGQIDQRTVSIPVRDR